MTCRKCGGTGKIAVGAWWNPKQMACSNCEGTGVYGNKHKRLKNKTKRKNNELHKRNYVLEFQQA